jgi:Shikimate kinase
VAGLVRGQDAVIALGGGAVEDPRSRAVLRNARVVYLRVSYDEAMARVQERRVPPHAAPAGPGRGVQAADAGVRGPLRLTIDTDGRRPDAVALEVLARLTRRPETSPVNRVAASLASEDTGGCLRELDRLPPGSAWPRSAST